MKAPKLADLAFACYIYGCLNDDDATYRKLLDDTKPALDLKKEKHRTSLLEWLDKWGCRIEKDQFALISNEIKAWWDEFGSTLFPEPTTLLSLTDSEFDTIQQLYDGLVKKDAIGPTITAKILFALRPDALIAWDAPVRTAGHWNGFGRSYCHYLRVAKGWLDTLGNDCKSHSFELDDLPSRVGRPRSSVAKLIDEYLWITVSNKCPAPDKGVLKQWFDWS